MNDFLRRFIMDTIRKMYNNVPEWQVREYSIGWYSKGVLIQDDLEEIASWYEMNDMQNETEDTEEGDE